MALLHTPPKDDYFTAPDFKLKNINGDLLSYNDIKGEKGTVIAFICNHCPYVQAIINRFAATARQLQDIDIGVAAIMPNDTKNYPADSFENMQNFAKDHSFTFPYLLDATQETAKAYGAVCTPDIYGFDARGKLVYRGRLDSAGPNPAKADTVPELLNAMVAIAKNGKIIPTQHSSMGCSIKWRE